MTVKKARRVPDASYERGDIAVVTSDTRASRAVGNSSRTFRAGTRVIVSRVRQGYVRARIEMDRSYSYIWIFDSRVLAPSDRPLRYLGDAPEDGIRSDDPRLDYLWRDAAVLADLNGHCTEYDSLCDILGIPGRERTFAVRIEVAPGVELRGDIRARSYVEAERILRQQLNPTSSPLALESAPIRQENR